MASVDRSTVWPYDADGEPQAFFYSRYAHPTGVAAERALGQLEGGDALLYASGTGATTAIVLAFASPDDTIALAEGAYYGTSVVFDELARWGLRYVEYDQTGPPPDDATILWVEAPSNPTLTLPDWDAVRAHRKSRSRLVVCDATVSTPVHLRALDEGADVVLHSATKYLTGHHDALLGATVTRDPKLSARLQETRGRIGVPSSPDAAGALLRGLKTLELRVRRQTGTAADLARRLEAHPAVERVRYPGIGGLVSFDVPGDPRPVETATTLIRNATSLGGTESTMESRSRWEGDRIPAGLLRLSVGLEDADDLWADLDRALGRTA